MQRRVSHQVLLLPLLLLQPAAHGESSTPIDAAAAQANIDINQDQGQQPQPQPQPQPQQLGAAADAEADAEAEAELVARAVERLNLAGIGYPYP
jgi:hypothetical protein